MRCVYINSLWLSVNFVIIKSGVLIANEIEREPITGSGLCEQSASGVQGQSPWSGHGGEAGAMPSKKGILNHVDIGNAQIIFG